ncbi:MAG: CHAT domain-containing protein [Deltaproteobacteria bacterium]|nr:CHAT domain-containing protein [Deltaproteobacteria bacterium]
MLRSLDALKAQAAYEETMSKTPAGARSESLRARAHRLSARGEFDEAHGIYSEAAALFAHDDESAAAASCWYDLGQSHENLASGVREENLLHARELFERALRSPARQRTPLRLAQSHDALGRVLRALAELGFDEKDVMLREAEEHIGLACRITEGIGPLGLLDAAGYRHNLGNLFLQRRRWDDAERSYRRALALCEDARRDPLQMAATMAAALPVPPRPLRPLLVLGLARMQVQRGRTGDLGAVLRGLDEVICGGDQGMVAEAHLLAAQAILRHEPRRTHEAQVHLRAFALGDLKPQHHLVYLRALRESGQPEVVRRVLRLALRDAMARRTGAIADHASDHGAHDAQQISLLAAQLHAEEGRPVEAFLALEETAALRYFESVHWHGRPHGDAISRALANRRYALGAVAGVLDELASHTAHTTDADARSAIDKMLQEFERALAELEGDCATRSLIGAEQAAATRWAQHRALEVLREARPAPSLPVALHEGARALGAESLRAATLLARRDPEGDHRHRDEAEALDADALRKVLDEHPGDVLLRVSVGEELLAVAVWLDGSELKGRSCRRSLGREAWRALQGLYDAAARGGSGSPRSGRSTVSDALAVLLPLLDLNDALPERPIEHLVVLPSLLASLIPWVAAGRSGRTLLDRAEAISYLPNLTPRVMRQRVVIEREGTVLVAPGEHCHDVPTRFHDLAFCSVGPHETALFGADATRARLQSEAARTDVVSVYTHGIHIARQGAGLSLADGDLSVEYLGASWAGCERVELWACQSGVNLPTDCLTPLVDEAFGIDSAFHHAGVRSTIGSLWSVPAFVTAHIVSRYRERLAAGDDPPRALVTAQRWWRDAVLAKLPEILERTPARDVADAIAWLLGARAARDDLAATLGGVAANAPLPAQKRAELLRDFSTPEGWAGFRFMGVAGRRPVVIPGDAVRPITPEEQAELDALLAQEPEPGRDVDTIHRERLAEATALDADGFPTPTQAITVGRFYAERGLASLRHNLLRGLAWVHEALAAPTLAEDDRGRLSLEAAWLWTELARGELDEERLRPLFPTDPVLVARARAMLDACPTAAEEPLLRAWVLSDNCTTPTATITPPHREGRGTG